MRLLALCLTPTLALFLLKGAGLEEVTYINNQIALISGTTSQVTVKLHFYEEVIQPIKNTNGKSSLVWPTV